MPVRAPCLAAAVVASALIAWDVAAETIYRCRGAGGAPLFTDLPCSEQGLAQWRRVELPAADTSFVTDGGLSRARSAKARAERCERARAALATHRAKRRQPHKTPMYRRARELRARVREHCH